jgi:Flp pilus assembly protein CpaB
LPAHINRCRMTRTQLASLLVAALLGSYALAVALIGGFGVVHEVESARTDEQAKQEAANADAGVFVPVAAKQIPIGQKITKAEVNDWYFRRPFPKSAVPPNTVLTLEELGGKRAMRTIRQGEMVMATDVNGKDHLDPPDGTVLMTVRVAATPAMTGFTLPGYKVMVEATKVSEKRQKEIVLPLIVDVLILAVDTPAIGGNDLIVSLAVPDDKVEMLTYVVDYGADIRLRLPQCGEGLRRETDTQAFFAQPLSVGELRAILDGD